VPNRNRKKDNKNKELFLDKYKYYNKEKPRYYHKDYFEINVVKRKA
jgi:ribosomal 30S subunit maturation factor RimM